MYEVCVTDMEGEKLVANVVMILKGERESRVLSQRSLASQAGVDPKTISLIERGCRSPTLFTLARIASALGLTLSEIIEAAEEELPK